MRIDQLKMMQRGREMRFLFIFRNYFIIRVECCLCRAH